MQPTAIVLHGPTSAGKTTLAKVLQATSPLPAFHLSLDAFVTMSNRRDMRSDEERAAVYRLHCENLRSTLARIARTEFDIILDLVLRDETEFQACLTVLSARPTYVIGVSAPLDVLEARERVRPDRAIGIAREQISDPAYKRQYDLMLDTSIVTAEAGAAAVRKLMAIASADAAEMTMRAAPSVEAQLRQLEEELLQPEVRASAERVSGLLADDFVEFGSSGRVFDKKQIIELLGQEISTKRSLSEFALTVLAEDVVLVTYRATRSSKPPVHSLRSSVWRLRNGRWQMVFHQGTLTGIAR